MPQDTRVIEQLDGSEFSWTDRVVMGLLANQLFPGSPGALASVAVSTAGSYASLPTLGTTGHGTGASFSFTMKAVSDLVVAAGSGYVVADTITLTGGTHATASILTVLTTKLVGIAVDAAGLNYAVGDLITLAGGTFSAPAVAQVNTIGAGGALLTVLITVNGSYTVNSENLTQSYTTGIGSGATFNTTVWGVNTASVSTAGSYTVLPANPVAQGSTTGSGTGATFSVLWGVNTVTGSGGSGYDATTVLNATVGGVVTPATFALTITYGTAATTVSVLGLQGLPVSYGVSVTPGFVCEVSVPFAYKTVEGFNILFTGDGSTALTPSTFDVLVVA